MSYRNARPAFSRNDAIEVLRETVKKGGAEGAAAAEVLQKQGVSIQSNEVADELRASMGLPKLHGKPKIRLEGRHKIFEFMTPEESRQVLARKAAKG